ncbi:MAG: alpha-amylase family glycosyl hydrolase [Wenzhouxiangellaceae bacterium]
MIYFVMPDRFANGDPANDTGGIEGGRAQHGFDPTHKGFYHGGDLVGLTQKLDYIQGLGATAIWLTPVFVNRVVQGPPHDFTAGYHGYWITDFTGIDPHLGTRQEFGELVRQAHDRGMRVIMDIVINHTADIIQYRECTVRNEAAAVYWSDCEYRSIEEYPWTTRGGPDGETINAGFEGDAPERQTSENFARLDNPDWAYEVFIPERDRQIKVPDWLNDPLYYHNRGNSHWEGESSLYGDFSGLDDVFTEHPRVVEGMLDIYTSWLSDFRIDGFRVDTAKHVNDAFWTQFNPKIVEHAGSLGIHQFHLFGEAYAGTPEELARYTTEAAFPSVLDFAFAHTAQKVITGEAAPTALAQVFERDELYRGAGANALPTFIGNHDDGRIGHFLIKALGTDADEQELLARTILGHGLMLFSRGVPVIYYGDEQGFTGDGRDQDARENMFPSRVEIYNDNRLIGTDATAADDNFNTSHPIYRAIAEMAQVRAATPALRRGVQQVLRADDRPGLLALHRATDDQRAIIVFNTGTDATRARFYSDIAKAGWRVAFQRGLTDWSAEDDGLRVQLEPLSFAVFIGD